MTSLVLGLALMTGVGETSPFYKFEMNDIDGKRLSLEKFKGKVVLVVNVASFCGNTKQYANLEVNYLKYKSKGFVTLGFPANNFNGQEPGSNQEIKEFCTSKYNVTFPMMAKISVKGDDIHPLYKWLISQSEPVKDIDWNFAKFLINREGKVIARFPARMNPEDPQITSAIEKALN